MNKLIAYVDGSYDINTSISGAGIVFLYPNGDITKKSLSIYDEERIKMRNVSGEIAAATYAIRLAMAKKYESIEIHYDYDGICKWANAIWKTNNKWTKEYKEFVEDARKSLEVTFVKEKAHSGCKYNDIADAVAKHGAGVSDYENAQIPDEAFVIATTDDNNSCEDNEKDNSSIKTNGLYFVSVFSGYSINALKTYHFHDATCVGFFETLKRAERVVENNCCDIWETCYDYAVIEKIEYGLYPIPEVVAFYKYDMNSSKYVKTELSNAPVITGGCISLA